MKAPHARHDARWGRRALRRDQYDVIAHARTELARERRAENDAELPGLKVAEAPRGEMLRKSRRTPLLFRQHTADARACDVLAVREHRLLVDVGHCGEHAGLTQGGGAVCLPIGE